MYAFEVTTKAAMFPLTRQKATLAHPLLTLALEKLPEEIIFGMDTKNPDNNMLELLGPVKSIFPITRMVFPYSQHCCFTLITGRHFYNSFRAGRKQIYN